MEAQFTLTSGQRMKLSGFRAINRERLRAVESEALTQFARSGELDLIYTHLFSLRNVSPIAERIRSAESEAVPTEKVKASPAERTAVPAHV
jgi:hypothetical protein